MIICTAEEAEYVLPDDFAAECDFLAPFRDQPRCTLSQQQFDDLIWLSCSPSLTSMGDMIRALQTSDFYGINRCFETVVAEVSKNVAYYYRRRQVPSEWIESLVALSDDLKIALLRGMLRDHILLLRKVQQWHIVDRSRGLLLMSQLVQLDAPLDEGYYCSNPEGTLIVMGGIVVTHGYRRLLPLRTNEIPIVVGEQVIGILDEGGRDLQTGKAVTVNRAMLIAAVQVCYYHHTDTDHNRGLGYWIEDDGGDLQLQSVSPHDKYGVYVNYGDYSQSIVLRSLVENRTVWQSAGCNFRANITIWSPSGRTALMFDDEGCSSIFVDGAQQAFVHCLDIEVMERPHLAVGDRYLAYEDGPAIIISDFADRCREVINLPVGDTVNGIIALTEERFLIITGGESHSAIIYTVDNNRSLDSLLLAATN